MELSRPCPLIGPFVFCKNNFAQKAEKKGENISHMGDVGGDQTRIQFLLTIPRSWLIWNIYEIVPAKTGEKTLLQFSRTTHATPIQIHHINNNWEMFVIQTQM